MTSFQSIDRRAIGAAVLAAATALVGCADSSPQTGVVVEITTDLVVPAEVDEVFVSVADATGRPFWENRFPLAPGQTELYTLPLRVGVQPRGSADTSFSVRAFGRHGIETVVSRSATVSFIAGRVLLLPLPLLAACAGVACTEAGTTCTGTGSCGEDTVDPTTLGPYHPGSDAGAPPDARDGGNGGAGGGVAGAGGTGGGSGTGGSGGASGSGGTGGGGGTGGSGGTGTGGSSGGRGGSGGAAGGGRGGTGGSGGAAGTGGSGGSSGTGGSGGGGRGGTGGAPGTGGAGGTGGTGGRGGGGGTGGTGGTGVVTTLNNGLVGYWAFDQAGLTFPDYSGNANTLNSPSATAWNASGQVGGALDLTSVAYFVASSPGSASVNTITSAVSIAGWIVPQGGALRTIVSRVINIGFWKLSLGDNGAVRFTAGPMVAQAPNAAGDGSQWVHVAATYDGAGVRLYVGGTLAAQSVFGAVSLAGGSPDGGAGGYGIDIGGTFDNINAFYVETWRGRIDELTIYNRALTPSEVDALAHGGLPARR